MVYRTNSRTYWWAYRSKWKLSVYRWNECSRRSKSWPLCSCWILGCWCVPHRNWQKCFRSKSVPCGFGWMSMHSWLSYHIPKIPNFHVPYRSYRQYCQWWFVWSMCRTNRTYRRSSWKRWCSCYGWSGYRTRCYLRSSCFWLRCMNGCQRPSLIHGHRCWLNCWF